MLVEKQIEMISLMNLTAVMINEELSYVEAMMIYDLNVACAGICVRIILLIVYFSESFWVSSRGSQTGLHIPPGVHFDYSNGTLSVT